MATRRSFLAGVAAAGALTACGQNGGMRSRPTKGTKKISYGRDKSQFGELSRPSGTAKAGTIVLIHGGFWRAQYDLSLGRPLAADLVAHGYTCWNLEYRRLGDGGGWPATLDDVAAGIDHLAALDVDTSSVVAVGHSAGGQLATWAAGRAKLTGDDPGATPKVALRGVVSQAGVLNLAVAAATNVGAGAPQALLGGDPAKVPERYHVADPIAAVPIAAPVFCVHARGDANVPYAQSTAYVEAATRAGGRAALHTTEGDHFTLIDPKSAAWATVRAALPSLLTGSLPRP